VFLFILRKHFPVVDQGNAYWTFASC